MRLTLFAVLLVSLLGCTSNPRVPPDPLADANRKGVMAFLSTSADGMLKEIDGLRQHPRARYEAEDWYRSAKILQALGLQLQSGIDSVEASLNGTPSRKTEAASRLARLLAATIDTLGRMQPEHQYSLRTQCYALSEAMQRLTSVERDGFLKMETASGLSWLNELRLAVALFRYGFSEQAVEVVRPGPGHSMVYFKGIHWLDRPVIRQGDGIVIRAGMGAFSDRPSPTITFDGRAYSPEEGLAMIPFRPNDSPGTFKRPLRFEWTDVDGRKLWFDDSIEYTIIRD